MVPSVLSSQLTYAFIVTWGLQHLKNASWFPWLNEEKVQLARFLSIILAFAGTIGIHVAWTGSAGTLTITGLAWATVGPALWHCVQQFVMQEMSYHAVVKQALPSVPGKP
jgi:hypothetical protein